MKKLYYLISLLLLASALVFTGCDDDDDPPAENEEEIIDFVRLTFMPAGGGPGDAVSVEALDSDADGPLDFQIPTINLLPDTTYTLTIEAESRVEGKDITEEIQDEATAHQFFFAWTGQIFDEPNGFGNFADDGENDGPYGSVNGMVNYDDEETEYQDEPDDDGVEPRAGVPVGLRTIWQTGSVTTQAQEFRVVLRHQPGIKMADTNSNTAGSGTDIDITYPINIVQ